MSAKMVPFCYYLRRRDPRYIRKALDRCGNHGYEGIVTFAQYRHFFGQIFAPRLTCKLLILLARANGGLARLMSKKCGRDNARAHPQRLRRPLTPRSV